MSPSVDVLASGSAENTDPNATEFNSPVSVVDIAFSDRAFFDFDSAAPGPGAEGMFTMIAKAMRRDVADTKLTLVGHTDAIGGDAYNIDLSRRRALSVMTALVRLGVDPNALSTVAVGKRQPIAPDDTEAGRAANRRVEFLISPSLQANLAVVSRRDVNPALLNGDLPETKMVQVLRPSPLPNAGIGLEPMQTIALTVPIALPAAPVARRTRRAAASASGMTGAAGPAVLQPAVPAVPRTLDPQYEARPLGSAPDSY